ncbi:MAG: hypothetical protein COW18_06335 [Zetaproteobacteria bacterium CG12_big_fil_rev_8_21_14_0_65_54_13]|nr:MAG: hypothetical protein COX55_03310 [Zetaproteobacteria bacterium CG23_combo_of_CG06-09_8_20_14_all_54_7]PIW48820.1 MAG: hypothetical protein COW18_06335 [Zetaproteobacteria bacterium CG12_big_fil_rev_8_21_14_0_65_54_13]
MNKTAYLFTCHPLARFLAGGGLIAIAISSRSILMALLLSMLAACLIRFIDGNWLTTYRLTKLLGWFVAPILLLHGLFSPGQLLFPGTLLPLTREGMQHGIFLSVHLAAMFTAAMVMFRLLTQPEWLRTIVSLPLIGKRLLPFVWMIGPMHQLVGQRLRLIQRQYRLRKHWRMLPQLLLGACSQALAAARPVSQALWLRWPLQMEMSARHSYNGGTALLLSLALGFCGFGCMMLAWI